MEEQPARDRLDRPANESEAVLVVQVLAEKTFVDATKARRVLHDAIRQQQPDILERCNAEDFYLLQHLYEQHLEECGHLPVFNPDLEVFFPCSPF